MISSAGNSPDFNSMMVSRLVDRRQGKSAVMARDRSRRPPIRLEQPDVVGPDYGIRGRRDAFIIVGNGFPVVSKNLAPPSRHLPD
jgi:hypothetical protein